ncbi:pPIWI_RE module domain-containing protein [Amycolatopsis sp. cmx-11-12]|uniref:pPIWI_RE module domain-containing protein n=1 Tax=Amycolatopsis sp. cmx-11-12 TaxID=2785795 RepID=UPI0039182B76
MTLASRYTAIRRAAYETAVDGDGLTVDFHTLQFPEALTTGVLDLVNLERTGRARWQTPPTRRLDSLLQALDVRLGVLPRQVAAGEGPRTWLYCPEDAGKPLPVSILLRLLEFWIEELGSDHPDEANRVRDTLLANPPVWQEKKAISLTRCGVSKGGTAQPDGPQYLLTTQHFARRIQELEPYDSGEQVLRFRSVARRSRQQGAELMSQPLFHDDKHGRWWFSVVATVTLHTVPFHPRPRVHLHFGVRRWATHPDPKTGLVRLGYRRASAVYLRPVAPWLPGVPVSERYSVAHVAKRDDDFMWRQGDLTKLMERLALGTRPFPDPAGLLGDPERWFKGERGVDALIAYSSPMGEHGVGAGFMSHERSRLVEWAEQALLPDLARVADLTRSELPANKPANVRKGGSSERTAEGKAELRLTRRTSLAALYTDWSGTPEFAARLLWRTDRTRDEAIVALAEVLGLEGDGGASEVGTQAHDRSGRGEPVVLRWRTRELVVTLSCLRMDNGLTESLGVPSEPVKGRADRAARALAKRRADMGEFLAKNGADAAVPSVALVEIHGRIVFRGRNDPKFALRLGAADSGVVTQFITSPGSSRGEKTLSVAAESSWVDALRQLGATVVPRTDVPTGLPAGTQYLAVWTATKARGSTARSAKGKFPVAVLVRPGAGGPGEILAWDAEAVEGMGAWIAYPRYLARLPALAAVSEHDLADDGEHEKSWFDWPRTRDEQRSATEEFLHRVLSSDEIRGTPTVVLVDAQNIRNLWTWVQDGEVRRDLIRTGVAPAGRPNPWLRLVRIRTGERRETPQWWGLADGNGVNGLPANLWKSAETENDRIFYSTTPKASTAQSSAVGAHKLQNRPIRLGDRVDLPTIDIDKPAWNPGLVEIAVLSHNRDEEDDPHALAMAVHQLRQAPDYRDALSRPLPLHLAQKAQEYILPMRNSDEEDETDAPDGPATEAPVS